MFGKWHLGDNRPFRPPNRGSKIPDANSCRLLPNLDEYSGKLERILQAKALKENLPEELDAVTWHADFPSGETTLEAFFRIGEVETAV